MSHNDALYARPELLQIADSVARDKNIDMDIVIEAMEIAIQKAGRSKYGPEYDIRASIDRSNGAIHLARYIEVVEEVENSSTQMTLEQAKQIKNDVEMGEFIVDPLPPIDFGRVAAQTARQVIVQIVRDAEKLQQFEAFKDKIGEIVNGVVKRVENGNIIVDIGHNSEGFLKRNELIPRERFQYGDRIRCYILDVRHETRGSQIFLSRTHPNFLKELFRAEVPEVYEGSVKIEAVARDPGSKAKMAVSTDDSSMDPVGACVGIRGSRVQSVVNELRGEKIDIVQKTDNFAEFVIAALAPAKIQKVLLDEANQKIEVVVGEDQLSLAIGRGGQNVRLASQLVEWNIDILTEAQEQEKRQQEFEALGKIFMEGLDVDEMIAHILINEGFESVEDIAYVAIEELTMVEAFDENIATELKNRAITHLQAMEQKALEEAKSMGVADDLMEFAGINAQQLCILAKNKVFTLDDFADLSSDELLDILPRNTLSADEASNLILEARKHWFDE